MFNSLGQQILEQNNPSKQIDISNLSSGLLFVHIQTQDDSIIKKVLKE
ncbi:MAG: T9SS type A sorting domain-containing protein [Flavobacteriaceae bacterium]|nr:T9SS type A sorting domain-containing protein [Flavobacteriaceae bacterium]